MRQLIDLLLLGNPQLYQMSQPVKYDELQKVTSWVADLHNVMQEIRLKYNFGRGIAAPQLGIMKQLIYINIDNPLIMINPEIIAASEEMMELWDDCMCFPNLLVKVKRHKEITLKYLDENWNVHEKEYEGDMSELVQHEIDHLKGILCTMRAIDDKSFKWR